MEKYSPHNFDRDTKERMIEGAKKHLQEEAMRAGHIGEAERNKKGEIIYKGSREDLEADINN